MAAVGEPATTAVREQLARAMYRAATGLPWPTGDRDSDRADRDHYRNAADAVLADLADQGVIAMPAAGHPPAHLREDRKAARG